MNFHSQDIDNVIFTVPITTPEVYASSINGHLGADFLTTEPPLAERSKSCSSTHLHFRSKVTVHGNILSDSATKSTLSRINSEAIRRFDHTPVLLNSPITFTDDLIVDDIAMMFDATQYLHLDAHADQPIESRVFPLLNKQFTKSLHIHDHFVIDNPRNVTTLRIDSFNGRANLPGLLETIVLDGQPLVFNGMAIFDDGFAADHMVITQLIDNTGYDDVREDHTFNVTEIFADILRQEIGIIKSLRVVGNVTFSKFPPVYEGKSGADLQVELVNGVRVSEYFSQVVPQPGLNDRDPLQQQTPHPIGGVKTFEGGLDVSGLCGTIIVIIWF